MDERSSVIGIAEAGIKINDVALRFDIHKIIAYKIINCFKQISLVRDRTRSVVRKKKQLHWKNVAFVAHNNEIDFCKQVGFAERLGTIPGKQVSTETVSDARGEWRKY